KISSSLLTHGSQLPVRQSRKQNARTMYLSICVTAPTKMCIDSRVARQFSLTIRPFTQSLPTRTGESYTLGAISERIGESVWSESLIFGAMLRNHILSTRQSSVN